MVIDVPPDPLTRLAGIIALVLGLHLLDAERPDKLLQKRLKFLVVPGRSPGARAAEECTFDLALLARLNGLQEFAPGENLDPARERLQLLLLPWRPLLPLAEVGIDLNEILDRPFLESEVRPIATVKLGKALIAQVVMGIEVVNRQRLSVVV